MELRFDFATDDTTTGFRLGYFEFYNWGTFNKKLVRLALNRENGLLTGDIGSGKSTIVDALTTLLVPHQKIIYNKAAGANTKERTLYSYIVGEYKTTQDDNFGQSKAVALRDENSFSVILGHFENIGYEESVTLAQFFWIQNRKVHKFFVVSKGDLSIKKDFLPKFKDIKSLKKRLRQINHTQVFDTFSDYFKYFGREMGIRNEQALNLFYQTVSLKAIGNLTQFIRMHMLENSNLDSKVDELCASFATLNHTHNLVLEATEQIKMLKPIKSEFLKYNTALDSHTFYLKMRDALSLYFSHFQIELLSEELKALQIKLSKANSTKKIVTQELEKINNDILDIRLELQKNGADRIGSIESEIKHLSAVLQRVKSANLRFNDLIKELGYRAVSNEHSFLTLRDEIAKSYDGIELEKTKLQNQMTTESAVKYRYNEELEKLKVEIVYLQNNRSNIPQRVSTIRDTMAKELGLSIEQLPFIGELIEVKDKKWHGAIERVMHNTALSVLVDSEYYEEVSAYVERTNLKGRLVYLKVDTKGASSLNEINTPKSLLHKIELKADTPYYGVLQSILYKKFDIPCVDDMADFRRFKRALSINGQYKANLSRHEKDDRFDINDKSRWVLGWDNIAKLKEFEHRFEELVRKLEIITGHITKAKKSLKGIEKRRDILRDILQIESFEEINWYRYAKEIEQLKFEKEELEKSNDIIKTLQKRLDEQMLNYHTKQKEQESVLAKIGQINEQTEQRQEEYNRAKLVCDNGELEPEVKDKLDEIKDKLELKIALNSLTTSQRKMREYLQSEIDKFSRIMQSSSSKIVTMQVDFISKYPVISKEFGRGVEYCDEFIKKLEELQKDNLPKWRKKFKQLLKENTIRDIVMLQSVLEKSASDIIDKIETINKSLRDIEYSDGTYIELVAQKSNNIDIKEFRQNLKQIITGAIDENNEYDEQKFLQIKELIERFNGREGYIDVDKKWRKSVIDVRNWFDFSARENYISDGSLKEFYAHSGGKSGGQKEKLAYTVLASSLAYQFGLEYDKIQSRSFRYVMIDEAFGRGSDESTRYALRLFKKLRLQLLVITPKQKINVIEPFVKSVHFVYNKDGMDSSLISMTIEEYAKNRKN